MKPKKVIKELKKQLRREPNNLPLRLQLAAALQEAGQVDDAVEQFCEVAYGYLGLGHLAQAKAVCESALGLAPMHTDVAVLRIKVEEALREDMKKSQVDDSAAKGEWVPSLAAGERAGTRQPVRAASAGSQARRQSKGMAMHGKARSERGGAEADESGAPKYLSEIMLTPTPLPAPLAPHEADDEDSMVDDSLERYRLQLNLDLSGPIPKVSLPNDILPVDDALLEQEETNEPITVPPRHDSEPIELIQRPTTPAQPRASSELTNPFDAPDGDRGRRVDVGQARSRLQTGFEASEVDAFLDEALDDAQEERVTIPRSMDHARSHSRRKPLDTERVFEIAPRRPQDHDEWRHTGKRAGTRDTNDLAEVRDTNDLAEARDTNDLAEARDTDDLAGARSTRPRPDTHNVVAAARLNEDAASRDAAPMEWEDEPTDYNAPPDSMDMDADGTAPGPGSGTPVTAAIDNELTVKLSPEVLQEIFADSADARMSPDEGSAGAIHDEMALGQLFSLPGGDIDDADVRAPLLAFSRFPRQALDDLAARMALRHYTRNQYIVRESESCGACFAIVSGVVSVLRRDSFAPDSEPAEVARLHDGEFFGEYALLANRYRQVSVRAVDDCHIYEIPRRLLRELAATYQNVGPLLDRVYREQLLSSLLDACPFFRDLPLARKQMLRDRFHPMRCESGEIIIQEGQPAGSLYLVVVGSLDITKRVSAKRSVLLSSPHEGCYVGDMAAWQGKLASATVSAAGLTELVVLPADDFRMVIEEQAELWQRICEMRKRRELENNQLLTGETTMV